MNGSGNRSSIYLTCTNLSLANHWVCNNQVTTTSMDHVSYSNNAGTYQTKMQVDLSIDRRLASNEDMVDSNVLTVSFQTNAIYHEEQDEGFALANEVIDHVTNKRSFLASTTVVLLVSWYSYHITFVHYYDYPFLNVQGIYQELDVTSYADAIADAVYDAFGDVSYVFIFITSIVRYYDVFEIVDDRHEAVRKTTS